MDDIIGIRILQITAHMGEGAGKAIGGLAVGDANNRHEIIVLEKPNKTGNIEDCIKNGVGVRICPKDEQLYQCIAESDIVVLNWWNHPTMIPLLQKIKDIPCRLLLWSHVNGINYPLLPAKFALGFDGCMFTSPISLHPPHWTNAERENIQGKSELVYGMGNFLPHQQPYKKDYERNNPVKIGFVGTLDYGKLHPSFPAYCKEVLAKGIEPRFLLAGEPSAALLADVEKYNLTKYVVFLGFQKDIPTLLTTFDIFGYLLNPNSFATTENALMEAMAAGLPIITSNGAAERAIIQNGVNGFVAENCEEYANQIEMLVNDKELRRSIGNAARDSVCKKYNANENTNHFHRVVSQALSKKKTMHDRMLYNSPVEYFLYCCPKKVRKIFSEAIECTADERFQQLKKEANELGDIFQSKRKGSPFQFSSYFPSDQGLQKICDLYRR